MRTSTVNGWCVDRASPDCSLSGKMRTRGRTRSSHTGRCQMRCRPKRRRTGSRTRRATKASKVTATARIMPISLGANGPDTAKVRNTAIITAAAEITTRLEVPTAQSPPAGGATSGAPSATSSSKNPMTANTPKTKGARLEACCRSWFSAAAPPTKATGRTWGTRSMAGWCGPCRMFAPVYETASESHGDVVFGRVDTEAERDLAERFAIMSIPTLMAFRDQIMLYAQPRAPPPAALERVSPGEGARHGRGAAQDRGAAGPCSFLTRSTKGAGADYSVRRSTGNDGGERILSEKTKATRADPRRIAEGVWTNTCPIFCF